MTRKISTLTATFIGLIILLLCVRPAAAGGWVVITLDELPGPIRAGKIVRLGFTVRQHGVTPINGVTPVLTTANPETGETITAEAQQVGETGHFEVAVVFPGAGTWEWRLKAPPFPQETHFEPITVLPAASTGDTILSVGVTPGEARAAMRWAGAGLLGAAALLTLVGRRRRDRVARPQAPGSAA